MPPLLVVDGDSLAHRAYHGLPKTIRDGTGRPANMLVGMANFLCGLWGAEGPRAVFVGWDTLTAPTYRHEALPAYQSGREFADALFEQLERLPELVSSFGFANGKAPGFEADDFLASAAAREQAAGGCSVVVTGDRDAYQLVGERTTVVVPRKGVFEVERVGPAEVVERYGVEPRQVPDFIALRGDPSDRIPGARGIGPAKAALVLAEHETLEAALAAGRFAAEADDLRLYRRIATMRTDAPVPELPDTTPDWAGAAGLAATWGLQALERRLRARFDGSED